jgi:hypothetical protein
MAAQERPSSKKMAFPNSSFGVRPADIATPAPTARTNVAVYNTDFVFMVAPPFSFGGCVQLWRFFCNSCRFLASPPFLLFACRTGETAATVSSSYRASIAIDRCPAMDERSGDRSSGFKLFYDKTVIEIISNQLQTGGQ